MSDDEHERDGRDRIMRGRGTLLGTVQILAASGWERSEIVGELDKVYNAHTGERTYLVARFDVSAFSETERECLARGVCVQGEETGGHPDANVVITLEIAPAVDREP